MKKILAIAAVLGLAMASTSNAAVILSGHQPANAVLVNGNTFVYTLTAATDTPGAQVAGFVGNLIVGGKSNVGFSGNTGQSAFPVGTPTQDLNAAIADENIDTQFLVLNNQLNAADAPFESASTLGGAFALAPAFRATSKALIQVAIPNVAGNMVAYNFGVSQALGDTSETFNFQGILVVPEPSTVALGAFGLLGTLGAALRRRMA